MGIYFIIAQVYNNCILMRLLRNTQKDLEREALDAEGIMNERLENLARDVMGLANNTLMVHLRFLDRAINRLELKQEQCANMYTDGKLFCYNPRYILGQYKSEYTLPNRDYLHVILHCVYGHLFVSPSVNVPLWNLATDIAVENVITELRISSLKTTREELQNSFVSELKNETKYLTAERIYRYLLDANLSEQKLQNLQNRFFADDHENWFRPKSDDGEGEGEQGNDSVCISATLADIEELINEWKNISEHMEIDLITFSKEWGDKSGALVQNIKEVNRERYDYTSFLKKFAVLGEAMKLNDEEFDYVFYTYGLNLYGKVPLIEPLEYKDVKRIREFVIAIDTSGSVIGEQVQAFAQKTYNILKTTESFFSKINLHIIQCDADIQEHVKITSQEEFDDYFKNFSLKGFGGTDFCPVFRQVDELIKNGEFINLKGLIYFTDGYGTFPAQKPNYQTAFVFVEDEPNESVVEVPSWAIKLVLDIEELEEA